MKTTELKKVASQVRRDIVRMVHGVASGSFYCSQSNDRHAAKEVVKIDFH